MNKIKNRIIYPAFSIFLIILVYICSINTFAVSTSKVLTVNDNIEQLSETEFLIPIYISENEGIMGFRLEFVYDKEELSIDYIVKGNVTKNGSFDSMIDSSGEWGRASVVWYHTENVKENGSIAFVKVTQKGNFNTRTIRLGYSQEDTFNESWQDVVFDCRNITLVDNNTTMNENDKTDNNDDSQNSKDKDILDIKPEDLQKRDFNNNEAPLVGMNNGSISLSEKDITDEECEKIKSEMNTDIENSAKEDAKKEGESQLVLEKIDKENIKPYITKELAKRNYNSITEIPEADKKDFWDTVKEDYLKDHEELREIIGDSDLSSLEDVVDISKGEIEAAKESDMTFYIILICAVVMLLVGVVVYKKKIKNDKEAKE